MTYCKQCGTELPSGADKCANCGSPAIEGTLQTTVKMDHPVPYKSPGTAALIALVGGLFGFPGIGHIYVGRLRRGTLILVSGLVFFFVSAFMIFAGSVASIGRAGSGGLAAGVVLAIALSIAYIVIWIWQIFNARTLAKKFNEQVKLTGKEPW